MPSWRWLIGKEIGICHQQVSMLSKGSQARKIARITRIHQNFVGAIFFNLYRKRRDRLLRVRDG